MIWLLALMLGAQPVEPTAGEGAGDAEAATVIANCNARKFETSVRVMVAGKPKTSKVKLCGKVGQSDAEWRRTLTDAVAKVAANETMPMAVKEQIIAALNLEIAKFPLVTELKPPPAPSLAPAPPITAPSLAPPRPIAAPSGDKAEYSTFSPLPAPKPPVAAAAVAAVAPPLPAPRLTLRCLATTRLGTEENCDILERDTLLIVRADENLPAGTSLRFLRRGDDRGEIALPALRLGQAQRFTLPPKLCSGVSGSRVQIEVVRAAKTGSQVVDTRGPFELRC